jgi:siroheme synthase
MGVAHRGAIAAELIDGGLPSETPVAAIRFATTSRQAIARCRLDQLGETAVESPAVIVIGAVAGLDLASR